MSKQLHHYNSKFSRKKFPLILICDHVNSPANIGSLFRIADSFGVEKIYFIGEDITVVSKRMVRTARSTHEMIPYEQINNIAELTDFLKDNTYTLIALEITDDSIPVFEYKSAPDEKIALIIGEESSGVSKDILNLVTATVHIPMHGNNSSMNVATATGIALYELTKILNGN